MSEVITQLLSLILVIMLIVIFVQGYRTRFVYESSECKPCHEIKHNLGKDIVYSVYAKRGDKWRNDLLHVVFADDNPNVLFVHDANDVCLPIRVVIIKS